MQRVLSLLTMRRNRTLCLNLKGQLLFQFTSCLLPLVLTRQTAALHLTETEFIKFFKDERIHKAGVDRNSLIWIAMKDTSDEPQFQAAHLHHPKYTSLVDHNLTKQQLA